MSGFETLATNEELGRHIDRHNIDRLLMLSDGVFAIAITLAALEIHVPAAPSLPSVVAAMNVSLFAYFLSFVVIAVFWMSNRDLFARVKHVDRALTALVLATLCLTALIPASVRITEPGQGELSGAFQFYALVMALNGSLNLTLWIYASTRPGIMSDQVPKAYRVKRIIETATLPLLFSIIVAVPTVAMLKWIAFVALAIIAARRFAMKAIVRRVV